jgi:hypothetical protein
LVIEAFKKITLKVGQSFIVIDPCEIWISAPAMVYINSGGSPDKAADVTMQDVADAAPAEPGDLWYKRTTDCTDQPKGHGKRGTHTENVNHAPDCSQIHDGVSCNFLGDDQEPNSTPSAPPSPSPAAEVVTGTPAPIPPGANSIVCRGGNLGLQINNTGPDRACSEAHESSHMADWKARYGNNLCAGVPDGQLPVGGPGYTEFLRQSECKAYRVGKACRQNLIRTSSDADKPAVQAGIDRDNQQLAANRCT